MSLNNHYNINMKAIYYKVIDLLDKQKFIAKLVRNNWYYYDDLDNKWFCSRSFRNLPVQYKTEIISEEDAFLAILNREKESV